MDAMGSVNSGAAGMQDENRVFHDCPEGGLAGLFGTLWPSLKVLEIVNCDSKIIRSEDLVFVSPMHALLHEMEGQSFRGHVSVAFAATVA